MWGEVGAGGHSDRVALMSLVAFGRLIPAGFQGGRRPLGGTGDPEASPPSRTSHMASCQPHHPRLDFNQQQLGFQDCGLQIFGTMKCGEKCGESS